MFPVILADDGNINVPAVVALGQSLEIAEQGVCGMVVQIVEQKCEQFGFHNRKFITEINYVSPCPQYSADYS